MMKKPFLPFLRMIVALAGAALAVGCRSSSPPTAYYALNAMNRQAPLSTERAAPPAIGIGTVGLPEYLERTQIVTRTGPNELRIDDFHRWAAPLNEEFSRVLAENLMILSGSHIVAHRPWSTRFQPDIVVGLQIFRFEAFPDGRIHLSTGVTLRDPRTEESRTWTVELEERYASKSYPDLVAAQSRALAELSRRIAEAISQWSNVAPQTRD